MSEGDDTVSVSTVEDEVGEPWFWFTASFPDGSTRTELCNDLRVFGYGGKDTITVSNAPWGTVSGGFGIDNVTLSGCTGVSVLALSPSEQQAKLQNPALVDLDDTITANGSKGGVLSGGEGSDTFNLSGDCGRGMTIDGGVGGDAVTSAANTSLRDGNNLTARGDWSNTHIFGGELSDRIDCQLASGGVVIEAGAGDDIIFGPTGNDRISLGDGKDTVRAMAGDDYIYAIDGWREISIDGGAGWDTCDCDWAANGIGPDDGRIILCEVVTPGIV